MAFPLIQLSEVELNTNNPSKFSDALSWKMRVVVLDNLPEPVTVSFIWVGSANSSNYDQQLDEFDIGPFPVGTSEFTLDCDGPKSFLVPSEELFGVTVLQIIFSYQKQVFLRVGYYARVAYWDDNLNACPPAVVDDNALGKSLIMNQPVITTVPIVWYQGQEEQAMDMF